jgi:hypothetical protein
MRLIDADALKERIGKICDESKEGYERSDFVQSNMVMMAEGLKNALFTEIDNEPTAQTWVTCEERLPEMELVEEGSWYLKYRSQFVLAQTKRGELFLSYCEKSEYKDNEICWYTFGTGGRKMRIKSKVVAWMLKPEPWKGETK